MTSDLYENVEKAAASLSSRITGKPLFGVVLGSGLSGLADRVENALYFPNESIPGFPCSTVAGHRGRQIFGQLAGKDVLLSDGRVHYYEGYPLTQVTLGVRVMARLGCKMILLSSAVGGIREDLPPGTLLTIRDHINMMGMNPLIGVSDKRLGVRFVDVTTAYDAHLRTRAKAIANSLGIHLSEGVLAATSGPSYETPAEIRMLKMMGADIVGMSLIPEAIVARQSGMKILAISCVTNWAAGITGEALTHEEVLEVTDRTASTFQRLVMSIIAGIDPVDVQ